MRRIAILTVTAVIAWSVTAAPSFKPVAGKVLGDGTRVSPVNAIVFQECDRQGTVRMFTRDRGKTRRIVEWPRQARRISELWPEENDVSTTDSHQGTADWLNGKRRLRLWFATPNQAGTFFAELVLAFLALTFLRGRGLKILFGVLSSGAFVALVLTYSRGSFLALAAGLLVFAVVRRRTLLRERRWIWLVTGLLLAAGVVVALGAGARFSGDLTKESNRANRASIWKTTPAMMVASPDGWGESGRAYMEWFQPLERFHVIDNMISDHLTFLVEHGWTMRFVYVFVVLALIGILGCTAERSGTAAPAAIVLAFVVSAMFNQVFVQKTLWIVPALSLIPFFASRPWRFWRGLLIMTGLAGVLAGIACVGLFFVGTATAGSPAVWHDGSRVTVNGVEPEIWIVDDGHVLSANAFLGFWFTGKEIRAHYGAHPDSPAVGYATSVWDVPSDAKRLVLCGKAAAEWLANEDRPMADEVMLLSPPFGPQAVPEEILEDCRLTMLVGEYAAAIDSSFRNAPDWVRVVKGAELYLPGWMKRITAQRVK